jgi:DNA-binding NarL/FixJ family response regulator
MDTSEAAMQNAKKISAAKKTKSAGTTKKRVFIVDDHPVVRSGLNKLLNNEPDLEVCGEGEETYAALKSIKEKEPDLVLLDVSLKDSDGLELAKELKAQRPNIPVLMLSMHDEELYTERALRAGARGFLMKEEAPDKLLAAIRKVLAGGMHVSEKMGANLLAGMMGRKKEGPALPMDRLTDRELEVFRMIGAGKSIKEIAGTLFLSAKTVEAHREHIKDKLNLKSSNELLRYAVQNSSPGPRK